MTHAAESLSLQARAVRVFTVTPLIELEPPLVLGCVQRALALTGKK